MSPVRFCCRSCLCLWCGKECAVGAPYAHVRGVRPMRVELQRFVGAAPCCRRSPNRGGECVAMHGLESGRDRDAD